jgi:hypothetical protein
MAGGCSKWQRACSHTDDVMFALYINARLFNTDGYPIAPKAPRSWVVDMGCVKSEKAGEITSA